MFHRITLCVFTLVLLIPFQNCTAPNASNTRSSLNKSDQSLTNGTSSANNGQPYDGKPYIIAEACADGTIVSSRIVTKKEGGGTLYRNGCQTGAPRTLAAAEIQSDASDPDRITFGGRVYVGERPAIPLPGMIPWYYQLTGRLSARPAGIYIIDMFDNSASQIQSLKSAGHTVICTISAGTVEDWRPDAGDFPAATRGRTAGSGERWLDTRSATVRSLMVDRLDLARAKGCHGIDFDSVDGYANNTGFPLTQATQIEYNRYLAFAAHDRGLILSLNNAPELTYDLATVFDFAIAEQCFQYNECAAYQPFIARGKPVLAAEYTAYNANQCASARADSLSLIFLNPELDGSRFETCF